MRAALLVGLALACLVASVSGATIVQRNVYAASGCTGSVFTQNITAGACTPSAGGYESSAWFSSADGAYVYAIVYSDRNCSTASAYQIQQTATGVCGAGGSNQMSYGVVEPTAAPISFPPSGWATSTSYLNMTNNRPASACATSTTPLVIVSSQSAFLLGGCKRRDSDSGTLSYSGIYAVSGSSTQGGTATFSDSACTTLYQAQVSTVTGCKEGSQVSDIPSDAKSFPTLPTTGAVQYENDDCSGATLATLYTTSACYNSQTFVCAAGNGTQIATVSSFTDTTNKGLCTDPATMVKQYLGDATVCYSGRRYNCALPTPGGGGSSASTAASSVVVMIVAAIVAVFATRSL